MSTTLLAIPCYNCAPQIKRVLSTLLNSPLLERIDQILLIDNFSLDETYEVARAMGPRFAKNKFIIIRNQENIGLGGSFKKIFQYAYQHGFDQVCLLHGDDQADIADISKFLDRSQTKDAPSILLGARFMPESRLFNYSLSRKLANKFLNFVIGLFCGSKIYDIGSGLNLYKVRSLPKSLLTTLPNHLAFDLNLLLFLIENKVPYDFIPISWKETDQISNAKNIPVFYQLVTIFIEWRIRTILKYLMKTFGLVKSQSFGPK